MTVDERRMSEARDVARSVRRLTPPNPWVGAVIVDESGEVVARGATAAPGGPHAEVTAINLAGERARGATLYVTLEPCCHVGRTGPCVDVIIRAGLARVVVGVRDPDDRVAGRGLEQLRAAGIDVVEGVLAAEVEKDLAPYLHHRRTGRPYVVAKVAATLDGRVAMGDGSSKWITSEAARADGHELRADSQAIIVGAGTVRADNPALTVRTPDGVYEPRRIVLGHAPEGAAVRPCEERTGDLATLLDDLGRDGVVQVLVEGGPTTVSSFLEQGLTQRVVWYLAPAVAGSQVGLGALCALATPTMAQLRRGRIVGVRQIGEDVRVDLEV